MEGDGDPNEALRESERRLRLAVEAAHIGIWDWNLLTNEMVWSEEAKAIAGFPAGKPVTFEQVRQVTHPDDLPRTSAMAQRALDPRERLREPYEYRIVRKDGEERWVLANGEAVFANIDDDGHQRAIRYIGTLRDITDRKEAESFLKASATRLRVAIDAARLGIWDYDVKSRSLRSSPELNRILGFPVDSPLDRVEVSRRYYPGDEAKVREAGEEAVRRGDRYFQAEFRFYWTDETLRWLLIRAEILMDDANVPTGAIGVVIDITDRKAAEERQVFLMRELIHRVRNTLASVRAIAASTLRNAVSLKEAETALSARIGALADLHTLLSNSELRHVDLRELVAAVIEPYRGPDQRVRVAGPPLVLEERHSLGIAMALHELATNATKYGALSVPEGSVDLRWTVTPAANGGSHFALTWQEREGPHVEPPQRRGFGTRLIEQAVGGDAAKVELTFDPKGLLCRIETVVAHAPHRGGIA